MESPTDAVLTQLRKGVLEYCVLACLRAKPAYGLELATRLVGTHLLSSEGTLYPLLSRLRRQGFVETTWQESTAGPPRRYYQLTDQGAAALSNFAATWRPFSDDVNAILTDASPLFSEGVNAISTDASPLISEGVNTILEEAR